MRFQPGVHGGIIGVSNARYARQSCRKAGEAAAHVQRVCTKTTFGVTQRPECSHTMVGSDAAGANAIELVPPTLF